MKLMPLKLAYHPDQISALKKVVSFPDDILVSPNQQVPELQYRLRQFSIYFPQLIAQHCCHSLPSGLRAKEGSPFQYQNQEFTFTKLGFGQFGLDKPFFTGGPLETRLPSWGYIFAIDRPAWQEFECYIQMYWEESIFLGPKNFQSDEFVPYIPFLPGDNSQ